MYLQLLRAIQISFLYLYVFHKLKVVLFRLILFSFHDILEMNLTLEHMDGVISSFFESTFI